MRETSPKVDQYVRECRASLLSWWTVTPIGAFDGINSIRGWLECDALSS